MTMMDIEVLLPYVKSELTEAGLWDAAFDGERKEWFAQTVNLIRTRLHTLKDFSTIGRPYFSDNFSYDEGAFAKNLKNDSSVKQLMIDLSQIIELTDNFNIDNSEHLVRAFAEKTGVKPGLIINAIRTAVTGQSAGPGLFEVLEAIGKERTVRRLKRAAELI
jgi:glutamyl-tRNA synthetase